MLSCFQLYICNYLHIFCCLSIILGRGNRMSRQNRKLSHHKSRHNNRRRVRNGDVFQPRPTRQYIRPCGCINNSIQTKNRIMMKEILRSRPECNWSSDGWVFTIPSHLVKKFGRCLRHLSQDDKNLLRERGLTV